MPLHAPAYHFGCPALQVDRWTSKRVPTLAYEFDTTPRRKSSRDPLNPNRETLAASMRTAWTNFAAIGNPSAAAVPWPSINMSSNLLSLVQPQPQLVQNFASVHHCAFWGTG
jgi:para-nitrobenzyl esterase